MRKRRLNNSMDRIFRWKNLGEAVQLLMRTGYFRPKQAESFAFHLGELLESAAGLHGHVRALVACMQERRRRKLSNALGTLYADLLEFTYHSRYARRTVERLQRTAPPAGKETEKQWARQILRDINRGLANVDRAAQAARSRRRRSKPPRADSL